METSPAAVEDHRRRPRVGLFYDEGKGRDGTPKEEDHPECQQRVEAIWQELESAGVTQRCAVFGAEKVEDSYVSAVHARKNVDLVRKVSSKEFNSRGKEIAAGFNSIYLNENSSEAAFLAAGGVLRLAEKVASGEINSGVAIVRPPGHHAEHDQAMGSFLFNIVAIAANFLLNYRHGNGTQKMFWSDPRVLLFSVHRFENGGHYPSGDDGSHTMIGEGSGAGFNINVPLEHGLCGDADYLAVWDHILIPVAESFNPDIILISGGFDASIGDPLGECSITPDGYSIMTTKLMNFSQGKVMLALEGGYKLKSLSKSVLACVNTLLGEPSNYEKVNGQPFKSTWHVICKVRHVLSKFWSVLAEDLTEKLMVGKEKLHFVEDESSDSDLDVDSIKEILKDMFDISTLPQSLSKSDLERNAREEIWRPVLSKFNIWYGSYGSNMWSPRFLCYIQGGQVEGMQKPCSGCKDTTLPKDTSWRVIPHQLFFGRSFTQTWGEGGVAFLQPERNDNAKTYMCMYRITLEQFNDLMRQENCIQEERGPPLFDLLNLEFTITDKSMFMWGARAGWYSNVLYLGHEKGLPIVTMTCVPEDVDKFKSGQLPLCPPSKAYEKTLLKGLVEGKQLSEEEAVDYLTKATL